MNYKNHKWAQNNRQCDNEWKRIEAGKRQQVWKRTVPFFRHLDYCEPVLITHIDRIERRKKKQQQNHRRNTLTPTQTHKWTRVFCFHLIGPKLARRHRDACVKDKVDSYNSQIITKKNILLLFVSLCGLKNIFSLLVPLFKMESWNKKTNEPNCNNTEMTIY